MSEITAEMAKALAAENERLFKLLERMIDQMLPLEEIEDLPCYSRVLTAQVLLAERDQLKAENADLQTGYKAYEQVNAELRAENERLDNALSITDAAAQKWLEERTVQQSALAEAWKLFDSILNDPRLVVAMPSALLVGVKDFLAHQSAPAAMGQGEH